MKVKLKCSNCSHSTVCKYKDDVNKLITEINSLMISGTIINKAARYQDHLAITVHCSFTPGGFEQDDE